MARLAAGMDAGRVTCLAAAFAAASRRGVHVVLPSDELVRREAERMAPHYAERGVRVATIASTAEGPGRRSAYLADVTYATARELGFDHLRDQLAPSRAAQIQRGHAFAILQDADALGLATRREPLVLSVPGEGRPDLWHTADRLVRQLEPGRERGDYWVDAAARAVPLTDHGITAVERHLGLDHLYSAAHLETLHSIEQSLRAHHLLQRDVDYRVEADAVVLLEARTGAPAPSRRLPHGLHEALEAKESVTIRAPLYPVAQITVRSYLRLYQTVGGLTASTRHEEPPLGLRRMLEYDEVEDRQRRAVYELRQAILEDDGARRQVLELAGRVVDDLFSTPGDASSVEAAARVYFDLQAGLVRTKTELLDLVETKYRDLATTGGSSFGAVERRILLGALDSAWQEQLQELEALREGIGLRAYGRRNPVVEYRQDAHELLRQLLERVARDALSTLFRLQPARPEQLDELRRRAGPPRRP